VTGPTSMAGKRPQTAAAEQPLAELQRRAVAEPDSSADFERQFTQLAKGASSDPFQAGRISIIGLDRAREKFGASWERLSGRIERIARNAIERYLLPGDIYTVWQETSYLIVFASLDLERARMKCMLIADEMMKALFGEAGSDIVMIDSAVTRVESGGDRSPRSIIDQLSPPHETPGKEATTAGETKPATVASSKAARALQFAYRPIWDTTLGALSAYLCMPVQHGVEVRTSFAAGAATSAEAAQLDFALQEHVVATLTRMLEQGCRALIVPSVHFETLAAGPSRRRYVETLTKSITSEMARLLVIEIVDVPDGVPPSRIHDLAVALRPYCRGVSARARIECADFAAFTSSRVHAVGCDIGTSNVSELNLMQLLARFSRAAEKAGIACFVHGLRSVSLMGAAVGAGFRYIDGEGVAKMVQRPETASHFSLGDAYRSVIEGSATATGAADDLSR